MLRTAPRKDSQHTKKKPNQPTNYTLAGEINNSRHLPRPHLPISVFRARRIVESSVIKLGWANVCKTFELSAAGGAAAESLPVPAAHSHVIGAVPAGRPARMVTKCDKAYLKHAQHTEINNR